MIKMFEKKDFYYLIVIAIAIVILVLRSCSVVSTGGQTGLVSDSLTVDESDSLRYYKVALRQSNRREFSRQRSNDITIKWLQDEVKRYKGEVESATVITSVTKIEGSGETIIEKWDTVYLGGVGSAVPVYEYARNGRWQNVWISSGHDSTRYSVVNRDSVVVTIGGENNGLFKRKEFRVSYKNYNPYTSAQDIESVTFKKSKRFGLGLFAGLSINKDLQIQPSIGIGLVMKR